MGGSASIEDPPDAEADQVEPLQERFSTNRGKERGCLMGTSSAACLRLLSDLKAITQEPPEGCSASPTSEENLFVWTATVFGPDETIWEGGIFCLRCGT